MAGPRLSLDPAAVIDRCGARSEIEALDHCERHTDQRPERRILAWAFAEVGRAVLDQERRAEHLGSDTATEPQARLVAELEQHHRWPR